jgi:twinkle protein
LYDQQGTVKAEKMIGVMRYAAEVEGVNHFILDSFMKCGIGEDDFNGQKKFIDNICTVARDSGMHIHVVCHARKTMNEKAVPGKMDVKGTGAITDQVDNVINWWRNKDKENRIRKKIDVEETEPDAMLICDKQRNGEWEGTIGLWFDPASLQFVQYPNRRAVELIDIGF